PWRSSESPGCSPTRMTRASAGPSPKTVWVARSYRAQPSQRRAALCREGMLRIRGRKGLAELDCPVVMSNLTYLNYLTEYPVTAGGREIARHYPGGPPGPTLFR